MNCGNCAREIRGDRTSCLYCGWTKADGLAAPTAARPVAGTEDPRTFRAGATTWRFLVWAVAATATGILLLRHQADLSRISEHLPWKGLAALFFVLGPFAFGAQLLRASLVSVTVDPKLGMILRGGRIIPWSEIESVEYAGYRLVSDQDVIRFLLDIVRSLSTSNRVFGLWGGIMMLLKIAMISVVGALIALVGIISGVLLPIAVLLSPWEPRVIVRTKQGPILTWRDLRQEGDFFHRIQKALRTASATS
jgi:hypothetical protein